MAVATIQYMSDTLWREVTYTVLLPEARVAGAGPYMVLLLLHGGNQSHSSWLQCSSLRTQLADLPLMVVLPDGAQSRWANGGTPFSAYEDFLVSELPSHVRHLFPASPGPWAIGGNSMGGFGAVRIGLKYPQLFYSIWAHSAVFPRANALPEHWYWTGDPHDLDCYAIVDQLDPQSMPRLSFDCGLDDHLLDDNRRFHEYLEARAIPHSYREYAGDHSWAYWNERLPEALKQHLAARPQS